MKTKRRKKMISDKYCNMHSIRNRIGANKVLVEHFTGKMIILKNMEDAFGIERKRW